MAAWIPTLFTVLVGLVLYGSAREWYRAGKAIRETGVWLPVEPRRPVPWDAIDLFLVGLLTAAKGYELWLRFTGTPNPPTSLDPLRVLASGCLMLFLATVSAAIVFLRNGCSTSDAGWVPELFLSDVQLGGRAFLLLAPIVYGMQFLLTRLHPTEHPLIQQLRDTPQVSLFAACGFSVVVCAPLYEEFLFRVLLQGWLEKVAVVTDPLSRWLGDNPSGRRKVHATLPSRLAGWPVIASSLWFALMHFDHGADPVPLFVLALGLGYLYQRTHRFTPSVVVHALLNFCTWLMLVMEICSKRE